MRKKARGRTGGSGDAGKAVAASPGDRITRVIGMR